MDIHYYLIVAICSYALFRAVNVESRHGRMVRGLLSQEGNTDGSFAGLRLLARSRRPGIPRGGAGCGDWRQGLLNVPGALLNPALDVSQSRPKDQWNRVGIL
jgi:hypothetical protein